MAGCPPADRRRPADRRASTSPRSRPEPPPAGCAGTRRRHRRVGRGRVWTIAAWPGSSPSRWRRSGSMCRWAGPTPSRRPWAVITGAGLRHGGSGLLARRRTDEWVRENVGQVPLSVITDRIAYPAMRVARLLGQSSAEAIDRTGAGSSWRCIRPPRCGCGGCRTAATRDPRTGPAPRHRPAVARPLPVAFRRPLHVGRGFPERPRIRRPHLCAGSARAPAGPVPSDPPRLRDSAAREGWIAVPRPASLQALIGGDPAVTAA